MTTIELPIEGIDCAECAQGLERALARVPGIRNAKVLMAAEKALLQVDGEADMAGVRKIVAQHGCWIALPEKSQAARPASGSPARNGFGRSVFRLLGLVVLGVVLVAVLGEFLGLFELLERKVPQPVGWAIVAIGGFPVFLNAVRGAFRRQITLGTLMSIGVIAATAAGQWPVGVVVVFFMRISDYVERFTTEQGRTALKDLVAMAPQMARVEVDGLEREVSLAQVRSCDIVVVRPGEKISVDGQVVSGRATIDQSSITGESMPVDVTEGDRVFAATVASGGSIRVRTERVGTNTTFGRVLTLVEEAESHRANVQLLADRVAAWYLPVVMFIAGGTFLLSRNISAAVAVLVVACPCSMVLATPIAILAAVGTAARRGLLIKGGKYIEALARADTLLVDKTGTLTLGQPRVTDVIDLDGLGEDGVLTLAATAERYSEHPLAEAVRRSAEERGLRLGASRAFENLAGAGVRAEIDGDVVTVGSGRLIRGASEIEAVADLESRGRTLLLVARGEQLVGVLGARDTLRAEVPAAIAQLRRLGVSHIELLTGDNQAVAESIARELGISCRANLMPEDKIAVVKELQAVGRTVVMVGDGVNDAPALAQANVGIAMGAAGTDVAVEASHLAVMRDEWSLVPEAFVIARRTMGIVRLNFGFTILYNLLGLALAAAGILPPALAAAAQSLPDFGIVGNSARLLRQ